MALLVVSRRAAARRGRGGAAGRHTTRSAARSTASAFAGPLLILALALLHAVVFYPAEIVDAAAGFAYGFFPALALVMVGWLLSGLVCWASAARWRGRCSTAGSARSASSGSRRRSSAAARRC